MVSRRHVPVLFYQRVDRTWSVSSADKMLPAAAAAADGGTLMVTLHHSHPSVMLPTQHFIRHLTTQLHTD